MNASRGEHNRTHRFAYDFREAIPMADDDVNWLRWLQFLFGKDFRETLTNVRGWISSKWRIEQKAEPEVWPELLIIGPGGVGKSTLARFLSGNFSPADSQRYQESIVVEEYELNNPAASVVVPPGQKHRRDLLWADIESGLAAGKFSGVILVMCYGYHSIGEASIPSLIGKPSFPAASADPHQEFLDQHLQRCLKDELKVVERIAPFIARSPERIWILTVVTKQDLWFDRDTEVRTHYLRGDYGKVLKKLHNQRKQGLQTETAFTCLITQNFQTGRNELLQNTIAGYDQARYNEALRDLLNKLTALRTWESMQ